MDPILSTISLRDCATALLDLVMPRHCVVCRRPLGLRERFICLDCQAGFPFTHFWSRSHNPMADKFNALIQRDLDDSALSAPPSPASSSSASPAASPASASSDTGSPGPGAPRPSDCPPREPYAVASALFFYNADSGYRRIPWHLKYEGGLAAGRHFARLLGARLAASPQFADVDVVIPVPLHWTRRWRRGYNQAEVIARELADVLGAELRTDILRRARRTSSQVRLPVEAKASNVRGAFALRRNLRAFPAGCARKRRDLREFPARYTQNTRNLREKPAGYGAKAPDSVVHVLLVDDTFTTGSTLNACRAMLRQAFPLPVRISVATLAFVSSD